MSLEENTVNFQNMVAAINVDDILIIDVRNPRELQETGVIPGSINVPCNYFLLHFVVYLRNTVVLTLMFRER